MTSLLHARRQQVVLAAPLRGGIGLVGGVSYKETLYPFGWATNETPPNPGPLLLPGGGSDHNDIPRRLRPRTFLVTLGSGADRVYRRRRVAAAAPQHVIENRRGNVDSLFKKG